MKRYLFIGVLFGLALLAACTCPDDGSETRWIASPELSAIDSLMWRQPDSALAVLMDYLSDDGRDGACTVSNDIHCDTKGDGACTVSTDETFDNHYANLLLAELLYKNYCEQTNRSELSQAVSYFDSLTSTLNDHPHASWRHGGLEPPSPERNDNLFFLEARAHYINGVGYYENDSMVEACKEYLKTLEVMENYFPEENLFGQRVNFMAMTYTRLTELFSSLYLNQQAIYFGKCSLPYYERYKTSPWHLSWMLSEIGANYNMIEELDSATYYYQQAISCLSDTISQMYRDIAARQAFLSYMLGASPSTSLIQLHKILAQTKTEQEKLSRCLTIGEIFFHERQYDSAWVYLDKVFLESNDIGFKKQAAEWLAEICKVQARDTEIIEFAKFLMPFANTDENQGALTKSQLTELCNNYEQGKQEILHQKKLKNLFGLGELILAIVVIFASIIVYVNKKRRGRLEAQKEETEDKLRTTIHEHIKELEEKELDFNRAIIQERQKAQNDMMAKEIQHSAVLGKTKNTIEHLQEEIKMLNERKEQDPKETVHPKAPKEEYDALLREGLCVNIRQRLKKAEAYTSFDVKDYQSLALSSKELSELIQIIDRHCPDFSRRLKKQYHELNGNDIQLCRFYLLNLKVLQVAILLGTDYSSVRKRTNRLKEKIGSEELHLQLKSFLFETC